MSIELLLLMVCIIVWLLIVRWKKIQSTEHEVCGDSVQENVQITRNIYGAIETFAALGHMWKQKTGWPYETRDYANINVIYTTERTILKMQYRSDCLAVAMSNAFPEIKAETDNIITYESSEVHSYDPNNPNALWEAFKRQSPNAILDRITQDSTGTWIFIKFC